MGMSMKMLQKRKGLYCIIVLLCFLCFSGCGKSLEQKVTEQLELGQKYLQELNYEEAIVAFNKVIEMDPKNVEAWYGVGHTCLTAAKDTEDTEKKGQYLVQAEEAFLQLEELEDDRAYNGLILVYSEQGAWEKIMNLSGLSDEESLDEETRLLYDNMLWTKDLIELCEAEDTEQIFEKMQTEEFKKIQDMVQEKQVPICIIREDGTGIGFYPVNTDDYGNCMVYYGTYENGKRQGNGMWIGYKDGNNYYAQGQWNGDYPNGSQKVQEWYGELAEGVNKRIISGNVEQGLWDGAVDWNFEKDGFLETFPVNFTKGKWVVIEVDDEDDEYPYVVCKTGITDHEGGDMTVSQEELDEEEGIEGFR